MAINEKLNAMVIPPLDVPCPFQRGMLSSDGRWLPFIPRKAMEVFDCYERTILLAGARKSSKTLSAACNKIMRHAWETDGAMIGIIGKTLRNTGIGVWRDLTTFTLPGWVAGNFGLSIHTSPRMTSDSHMSYFRIRNAHGGVSEVQLHSITYDNEVEEKVKSMRFSLIFVNEIDQFGSRHVLDILLDQLRMTGVAFSDHQLIADCNPPEEGEDSWVYKSLVDRTEKNKELLPNSTVFHFTLQDNPFLPKEEKDDLMGKYRYDALKYARFVEGRWVRDMTAGFFDNFFIFNIVVVGNADSPTRDEWELIVPPSAETTLVVGCDTGELNHAATFLFSHIGPNGDTIWNVFDELICVGQPMSLRRFGEDLWERVKSWNKWMEENHKASKVVWRHWIDSSAMNYKASSDCTDAMTLYLASGKNISFYPVTKGSGSRLARVTLVKRLLHAQRIYVSAHCHETIRWFRNLRPGKTRAEAIRRDPWTHGFDSATYALSAELPIELELNERPEARRKGDLVFV